MLKTVAIALVFAATPALAREEAFDLNCVNSNGVIHLRVDTFENEVCAGPCVNIFRMLPGDPDKFHFSVMNTRNPSETTNVVINRITGHLIMDYTNSGKTTTEDYVCERQPFTRFPANKF